MEHIVNVTAINNRMKVKPKGKRIHHFFLGVPGQLTKSEIKEIKDIVKKEHTLLIKFIDSVTPKKTA